RAWRDGEPTEVSLLVVGAILGLPIGVYFLTQVDPVLFRWLVSILSMTMLILLASGWRYQNPLNKIMLMAIGSLGGFMAGIAGISGPPVILTYMSSLKPASVIRGNTMMYLFFVDLVMFGVFLLKGLLVFIPLVIGLFLSVPYTLGGLVGQKIFNPNKEIIYRGIAYALIALSAIIGLPIWS
ncbi:MAG: sulfite exporter TauE/SafE family protein, partial [Rhodobacterales bacterium]|nr:sulfite exporter TauE/SafE family protein [Rhodobacterales bacterium]